MPGSPNNAFIEQTGRYPCGVCGSGVGGNSLLCTGCDKWTHKKCSRVRGSLTPAVQSNYRCPKCTGPPMRIAETAPGDYLTTLDGIELERVLKFCYLGDTLNAGGGIDSAMTTRIQCAWKKFRELSPLLTSKAPTLKLKGKMYSACVRPALIYGSETWALKVEHMNRHQRT